MGGPQQPKSSKETLGLLLAIASLIVGVFGSIFYGLFLSIPAAIAGIVAAIIAVDVKKSTNGQKGTSIMVVGIIGIIVSIFFSIGCSACASEYVGEYGCYGCAGGSCKAKNDVKAIYDDSLDELNDIFNSIDW